MSNQEESINAADWIALLAIFIAVISGGINFHLWAEVARYKAIAEAQTQKIQTMERTLLMTR